MIKRRANEERKRRGERRVKREGKKERIARRGYGERVEKSEER